MAPTSHDDSGLSEYEKQRNRNIAENRKILESIRQEQVLWLISIFIYSLKHNLILIICIFLSLALLVARTYAKKDKSCQAISCCC